MEVEKRCREAAAEEAGKEEPATEEAGMEAAAKEEADERISCQ